MTDLRQAHEAAATIATAALGRDSGPMRRAESDSHYVYVGTAAVVKIIDARDHTRLDRELALIAQLPSLTAALLSHGTYLLGDRLVRYACYSRVAGESPGMGLPGLDEASARALTEQAVHRLTDLHRWAPDESAALVLAEPLDHGGFTSRTELLAEIDRLAAADAARAVPRHILAGLSAIATRAPEHARADVPVHADCHWGNWLVQDGRITGLLDFEWARFGTPLDDWFFLTRFSGPHLAAVLDVIAAMTQTPADELRGEFEVREASYLATDLRQALERTPDPLPTVAAALPDLDALVLGRTWSGRT